MSEPLLVLSVASVATALTYDAVRLHARKLKPRLQRGLAIGAGAVAFLVFAALTAVATTIEWGGLLGLVVVNWLVASVIHRPDGAIAVWCRRQASLSALARTPKRPVQYASSSAEPGTVMFQYIDVNGRHSQRTVSISAHGDETFDAFCEDRQALRTFRYDRIQGGIIDLDTGEVLDVDGWRRQHAFS